MEKGISWDTETFEKGKVTTLPRMWLRTSILDTEVDRYLTCSRYLPTSQLKTGLFSRGKRSRRFREFSTLSTLKMTSRDG